jgi:hypothetical protein
MSVLSPGRYGDARSGPIQVAPHPRSSASGGRATPQFDVVAFSAVGIERRGRSGPAPLTSEG